MQPLFASVAEQMAATTAEQTRIRTFLADNKLATLPAWLGKLAHPRVRPGLS